MEEQGKEIKVFCCYARVDSEYLDTLKVHLQPLQRRHLIVLWNDDNIYPGMSWGEEIKKQLDASQLILLLISPELFASEYIYEEEMTRAFARREQKEAEIIPVAVRPVAQYQWDTLIGTTRLSDLQVLPKGAKPITSWPNQDEAWKDVAEGIEKTVNKLQGTSQDNHVSHDSQMHPIERNSYQHLYKRSPVRFLLALLTLLIVLGIVMYSALAHFLLENPGSASPIAARTSTFVPTNSPVTTGTAVLIPDTTPVLNDPLNNALNPYKWDTGQQGSATCSFVQGMSFNIAAPKNSNGGGCNTEDPAPRFTNFVYQIKMVINKGLNNQGGAGPNFYWDPQVSGGSLYSMSFDRQGHWVLGILKGANSGPVEFKPIRIGNSPSSLQGIGQTNIITIRVENHSIRVQMNGKDLFTITDVQLSGGTIGINLNPGTEDADVSFFDARVWKL